MLARSRGSEYTYIMWKTVQSKKRKNKKTKLALTVLGLIVLLILFSQVQSLTQTLFSPWKLSASSDRSYFWNGEFNINLILKDKDISFVSYNPKEQKIIIIKIPDETYLDVPRGFGKWQLRAVYDLGQSQLLKNTLAGFFGLPADGFVETNQLRDFLQKNPFSFLSLLPSLKTDLTLWELLRLKMSLSKVRFDKISELNLLKSGVLDRASLSDGSQVFIADFVKMDSILSDLADPNLVSEQKSVAIFNATDHPQLAQKANRLISNLGGHVIIVSNSKIRLKTTVTYGEKSATLTRLQQIFGADGRINPQQLEDFESSRAQINLFLGEDYFNLR